MVAGGVRNPRAYHLAIVALDPHPDSQQHREIVRREGFESVREFQRLIEEVESDPTGIFLG